MNKRARNRLVGVTVIILIVVAAIIYGSNQGDNASAFSKTVPDVAQGTAFVGKRVQVTGSVVAGSWNKGTNPMRFSIREEGKTSGPELKVVYSGTVPNTFGDDNIAIVTGTLSKDKTIDATQLIVKCPSKYQSKTGALTIETLLARKANVTGKPVKLSGFVVVGTFKPAGGAERFRISSAAGSGTEMSVKFDGGTPAGFADKVEVVLGGSLDSQGVFDATSVSLESAQKK